MPTAPRPPSPADPERTWRDVAPDVLATFDAIEAVAARSVPDTVLVPVRRAVAAILGAPSRTEPDVDDVVGNVVGADERTPACVEFAEQFVVDVSAVSDAQRQAVIAAMGTDAFTFVQAVYVTDVFTRARIAIEKLFGDPVAPVEAADGAPTGDLWPLIERFMQDVALMRALDPFTTELIRLRGARVHSCRLCQSRRSVKALDAAPSATVFDDIAADDNPDLSERDRVALALTDALVTQPALIDAALSAAVHAHFSVAETTEIVFDVVRNAANKIAVAFGADAPVVAEGIEFYDIDATGDVVADVDIDVVRSATAP